MITTLDLAYGHSQCTVTVPTANVLGVFDVVDVTDENVLDDQQILREALQNPIASARLREIAEPGQKVVIVTSDMTRPCPSDKLLPPILAELNAAGVSDEDITVVIALGLHRPMTEPEIEQMVGTEMAGRVRIINHDPEATIDVGVTSRGTPVSIFRPVVEADLRVCLGNLELHYFAGYSGGAKAILPGCAAEKTVRRNHAMMTQPESATGQLEGNPVRADLEEGVGMIGADFILNVIVDADHRILAAFAGDVTAAHRVGCDWVAKRGKVPIPHPTDIVIASAGGYPKDLNLYQAQKALDNVAYAVRPGGIIILLAECPEGMGSSIFEAWIKAAENADDLLRRIEREFVLGGHKAAAIGAVLAKAQIFLVTSMTAIEIEGLRIFSTLDEALNVAFAELGGDASVSIFPNGGSVLPDISGCVN